MTWNGRGQLCGLGKKINPSKTISFWGAVMCGWLVCSLLLFSALFPAWKTVSQVVLSTRVEGTGGTREQNSEGCIRVLKIKVQGMG